MYSIYTITVHYKGVGCIFKLHIENQPGCVAHSFEFVSILFVMYSFCNNKIDKENVYVWASLYIQKKLKYVGFFFFFGFHKHSWKKTIYIPADILWSSYPLTLATFFLVDPHNIKVFLPITTIFFCMIHIQTKHYLCLKQEKEVSVSDVQKLPRHQGIFSVVRIPTYRSVLSAVFGFLFS